MTSLVLKNSDRDEAEAEYAHPLTGEVAVGRVARPIWSREPAEVAQCGLRRSDATL